MGDKLLVKSKVVDPNASPLLTIAIIGVGRWGVHLLRIFLEHPQVQVVAVLDPNRERLAVIQDQYQLGDDVVLATEWETIQQLPDLDAVAIATPATTHYQLITQALKCGYHVLAEKPLALNLAECRELCQLAETQELILMVDHTYLFHPATETGRNAIAAGKVGQLRYGYSTRTHLGPVRQDVDALWDLAIHDIAIFNNWLGETPQQVQATGRIWLQGIETDLADLVWVTLTYQSGFQAFIHLCWSNPDKQRRLAVVGNAGTLIFDEMSPDAQLVLLRGNFEVSDGQYVPVNQSREVVTVAPGEPLKRVCDRFVDSINTKTFPSVSSGWVGAELVQTLTALTASLQQGGKPQLVNSQ